MTPVEDEEEWQPHAAEEFQQIGTVGKLAVALLGASTVTHLLSTWSDWNTYSVVHRYLGGMPNVDDADLNRADAIAKVTAVPNVIVSVAAAVVFVIWLWRVRVNSEVFSQADHRRSHGWVLASWFVPGPNLWYPKQIVDDVWIASDPKTPVYADDLRRFRTPPLTSVWWVAWIGALAFDVVVRRFLMWMEATVGSLRGIAMAGTASLVLTAISAVAATMIIRKINHMQTTRKWVPWWDQGPKLSAVPTYEVTQVPSYANDDTDEQPVISEPIAPSLGLVREPQLQMAGAPQQQMQSNNPFAPQAPEAPVASPFAPQQPQGFPGDGAAAPAAYGGAPQQPQHQPQHQPQQPAEAPKWSPFAPAAQNWQDNDGGPATEQFSPIQDWQEEQPAAETSYTAEPTWEEYRNTITQDTLGSASSWRAEPTAQPDPYSYQPQQPAQEEHWAARYSEPYSYESDYTSTSSPAEAQTAPEPEPAPVARAGRRAARVAVDSPSAIQPAVGDHTTHTTHAAHSGHTTQSAYQDHTVYGQSEHSQPSSHVSASSGYYEPAPSHDVQDDFLTPSKPLPPVPSYGPEPTYTPSNDYTDYGSSSYTSDYSGYSYENGSNQSYESYQSYGSQYPEQTEYQYPQEQQPAEPEQPNGPRTQPRRGRWV
ncbi:DUF4328 domain-containing protein [Kribbella sp. GL6]|uniref:DUF4328 domain-containing protein n=1 Tax=Kribbella sp. GL6 TaxID=3419765 RepID=UPI003D092238